MKAEFGPDTTPATVPMSSLLQGEVAYCDTGKHQHVVMGTSSGTYRNRIITLWTTSEALGWQPGQLWGDDITNIMVVPLRPDEVKLVINKSLVPEPRG